MSRTTKDKKKNRTKNLYQKEPQLTSRYLKIKRHGFDDEFNEKSCPVCRGFCEYERGYYICQDCGWGSFINDGCSELGELDFSNAA